MQTGKKLIWYYKKIIQLQFPKVIFFVISALLRLTIVQIAATVIYIWMDSAKKIAQKIKFKNQ